MREQHGPIKEQQELSSRQSQGLHFGNYDLVRRIDVGGMGEVYLAHQRTAFGRLVAIKIIRSDLVHDVVARQRFLREAEVSSHLKHEHILQLIEFGEEQGRLFLVTPYIEGGTLANRLERGPLSLAEMQLLFSALVSAVAYIHKRGVIHRDLKPTNILLDQEGDQVYVRLIDFGIATMQGDYASPQLTTAGSEVGTIEYMAPERLSGIAAPSNDIYSLGIILYQMITGHLPSSTRTLTLPQPLEAVVQGATEADPLDRYASADDLLKAFDYACRIMSNGTHIHPSLVEDEGPAESSMMRRSTGSRQLDEMDSGSLVLRSIDAEGVYPPRAARVFKQRDYAAQTAFLDSAQLQRRALQNGSAEPVEPKRPKRSLFALFSLLIVILILLIGGTAVLGFEATISAKVSITPRTQVLSSVFTLSAVPLYSVQDTQPGTSSGPTTNSQCFPLPPIFCPRVVTFEDAQEHLTLARAQAQTKITNDLQPKIAASNGTMIGSIQFTVSNLTIDPPVGTPSDTVTVTLTEQGTASYVKTNDVQTLLKQEMQQQFGANYKLLPSSIQLGPLSVVSINGNSATLTVAAGGVGVYQFSPDQLAAMSNGLKGLTRSAAQDYLMTQPGVDPKSIVIRIPYGWNTLPSNPNQITINSIPPTTTTLPTVQLTQTSATSSPTPTSGGPPVVLP